MEKEKQVTIKYHAEVTVTVNVPDEMTEAEIIDDLGDGNYGWYDIVDEEDIQPFDMVDLIVDGDRVNITHK